MEVVALLLLQITRHPAAHTTTTGWEMVRWPWELYRRLLAASLRSRAPWRHTSTGFWRFKTNQTPTVLTWEPNPSSCFQEVRSSQVAGAALKTTDLDFVLSPSWSLLSPFSPTVRIHMSSSTFGLATQITTVVQLSTTLITFSLVGTQILATCGRKSEMQIFSGIE